MADLATSLNPIVDPSMMGSRFSVIMQGSVLDKYGNKFGKSMGNALWLDLSKTSSYELYQYLINVDDEMVVSYLKIFTL